MSIHDAPAEKHAVIDRVGNRRDAISGHGCSISLVANGGGRYRFLIDLSSFE